MNNLIKKFDFSVTNLLLLVAMVVISIQCFELVIELAKAIFIKVETSSWGYIPRQSKNIAVLFFNILLTMEIMETVKVAHKSHHVKIRVILIVCLIAVSRKILMLETEHPEPMMEFAIAALIIALALGYYFISKSNLLDESETEEKK